MKRYIVGVSLLTLIIGLFLVGRVSFAADMPQELKFGSKSYKLHISKSGLWSLQSGEKGAGMVWPWPYNSQETYKFSQPEPIEEINGVEEEKGNDIIFKVNGSTANYTFNYEIVCSDNEMKVTYNYEAKKKLTNLYFSYIMGGNTIKDLDYEWGTEEGVPEGKGKVSAEDITVDNSVKYFKFYNFDGQDVTYTFNEGTFFKVKTEQWHTFSQDPSKVSLTFEVYPTDMDKGITIKKGTKGKISFTISFTAVEKKSDKKKK